jgi:hypothetical protein
MKEIAQRTRNRMHYTKEQLALSPSAHKLGAHNRTAQLQRPAEGRIVRSRDGPKNCSLIDSIITCLSKANTAADDSERSEEPGAFGERHSRST